MRTLVISARPSRSATALARALGIRKLATTGRQQARPIRFLNWGCSSEKFNGRYINRLLHRSLSGYPFINTLSAVRTATNKLLTFQRLVEDPEIPIPEFTTDEPEAQRWYVDGAKVVGRRVLTGHSGEGIVITDDFDYPASEGGMDVVHMREVHGNIPLYVKYMKKKHEYRVHVIGEHTDVQQKRKRQETPNEEVDYQVRNFANGWVYCREDLAIPLGMEDLAVRTVRQLGLDFGAVDIIWNQQQNLMTVLEVNSAPGLEGQTLEFYRTHLGEML